MPVQLVELGCNSIIQDYLKRVEPLKKVFSSAILIRYITPLSVQRDEKCLKDSLNCLRLDSACLFTPEVLKALDSSEFERIKGDIATGKLVHKDLKNRILAYNDLPPQVQRDRQIWVEQFLMCIRQPHLTIERALIFLDTFNKERDALDSNDVRVALPTMTRNDIPQGSPLKAVRGKRPLGEN